MPKGSQLSQLKSALSQAGISQPAQSKKRKRSSSENVDKERKAAKLREIQQKMNPFDVQVSKLKHDVGGRKIKGTAGRPAQSKQLGLQQRTKTLLREYEEKNRSGGILDRRFGENNPTMTPEERMLERFTRERQRASKGAMFNLEDEDELTHYGQSLSKLDDFDNVGLGLDDEDDEGPGQIDSNIVRNTHFGGFSENEDEDEEPARKKSKAEVMAEVITKSKEHKFLRKAQQAEDDNLRHELDQNMESIRSLLYATGPSMSRSTDDLPIPQMGANLMKDQDYDMVVRELAFEQRAKPKDRTKSEEEIALEKMRELETAERKRQKRMLGEEDSDSEQTGRGRGTRRAHVGGDDLEDDFYDEETVFGTLGRGLQERPGDFYPKLSVNEPETVSEDDDSSNDDEDNGESNDSDLSQSQSEGSDDGGVAHNIVPGRSQVRVKDKTKSSPVKDLPFVFPCPESHEEFLDIIDGIDEEDVPTVVQRIRTLHHPSLAEGNKLKLQRLCGVLVDHILHVSSSHSPRFNLISRLLPHLFALTRAYPCESAKYFLDKLMIMQKNLKLGLSRRASITKAKTWPGPSELSLLRVIGLLWSTSDLNHNVVSTSRLIMGAYLGLCRVRCLDDIGAGLFLCTLWLQYEGLSKRFIPEVVNFLVNVVLHLSPHGFKSSTSVPGLFSSPDFLSHPTLSIDPTKAQSLTVDIPNFLPLDSEDEQTKVNFLALSITLLERFADLYKGLDGFIELYQPIHEIFGKLDSSSLPDVLKDRISNVQVIVGRLLKFALQSRVPLTLQLHKPIPIPSYVPKFDSHASSYLRNRDPDHERNEAAKLRRQYKQEKKGAIRELRKDAKFLAGVREKEQDEKDKAYNERIKKAVASIEPERAEEKAMLREKAKMKRRSGKR